MTMCPVILPRYIKIGASKYTIVPRDSLWWEENGVDGQVRFDEMEIDIVVMRPASELANTLIHELLHVCYREWNIKPRCGEERTVTALGFALSALYAQNPSVLQCLVELFDGED